MNHGPRATVVYVAYATPTLDITWLPGDVRVVIVHNDDQLDYSDLDHPCVLHIRTGQNIGFGAAVNQAVDLLETDRVVFVNPDVELTGSHWAALGNGSDEEVRTIPLLDGEGRPTSVVNGYPTPLAQIVSGFRLGRFAPRGSRLRRIATHFLGRWGRAHTESLEHAAGSWPLSQRWVSGAVMSVAVSRFKAVGGFDPRYFLYYEDADLCERLARMFPDMHAVVVDTAPGRHAVGASDTSNHRRRSLAESQRLKSAIAYSQDRAGVRWQICSLSLKARDRWRNR